MGDIAIIPARGGSKRIPRKNLRKLCGVPLIVRTIRCLQQAQIFDLIAVSTEDAEIAEVAANAGASCVLLRPAHLADDHTPTAPVVLHAIEEIELLSQQVKDVCVAYPSVGLLTRLDFESSRNMVKGGTTDHVIAVVAANQNLLRAWYLNTDGSARLLLPEYQFQRTQDLPDIFLDAGQFYWSTKEAWMRLANGEIPTTHLHLLEQSRSQDIDTEEDWLLAEQKVSYFERITRD